MTEPVRACSGIVALEFDDALGVLRSWLGDEVCVDAVCGVDAVSLGSGALAASTDVARLGGDDDPGLYEFTIGGHTGVSVHRDRMLGALLANWDCGAATLKIDHDGPDGSSSVSLFFEHPAGSITPYPTAGIVAAAPDRGRGGVITNVIERLRRLSRRPG